MCIRDRYQRRVHGEFNSKLIKIDEDTQVKLQIWDTAGQESYKSIVRSFFRNSAAAFLVYNITQKDSFQNVESWLEEAREYSNSKLITILVGNQSDREDERQVNREEAEQFQKQNGINLFFETSAKDGSNVHDAFKEAAKMIFLSYMKEKMDGQTSGGSLNLKEMKGKRLDNGTAQPITKKEATSDKCLSLIHI
eukprot:TRINITY_DN948_c0_g1_i22.p2 TRINITY_DN948_c0_g1~~TRINITY_DN948_c0_g1_i22.p2  ORF type:complete len:194 (+),score=56.39 TRINITY_DN948_c0_g1_i22:66-647(+)